MEDSLESSYSWIEVVAAIRSSRQVKKKTLFVTIDQKFCGTYLTFENYLNFKDFSVAEVSLSRWKPSLAPNIKEITGKV